MGHLGMNMSRNGLIVLISVIFVAGAGTAYAGIVLPTITLAGDVVIEGDLTLASEFICPGGACVGGEDITDNSITASDVSNSFMKIVNLQDPSGTGWDPDNVKTSFTIAENSIINSAGKLSVILLSIPANHVFNLNCDYTALVDGVGFSIACTSSPSDGFNLDYVIFNLP